MTRHETIIAGRNPHPVRVERKIRRTWSRGAVHAAGTAAVEDALCPAGGAMTGARLRELLGRKGVRSGNGGNRGSKAENASPAKGSAEDLIAEISARDSGRIAYETVGKIDIRPGALADDVCRHIWAERGKFAPILYSGGMS